MNQKPLNPKQMRQLRYWYLISPNSARAIVDEFGKPEAYLVEFWDGQVYIDSNNWKKSVLDKLA